MREDCDYIVVALNDDDYIRRHKREPIVDEEERKNELYIFGVDEVVIFCEDSPIKIIKTIQPDIIYVGGDYTLDKVVGWPECEEWGGKVKIIERVGDYSTTNLIEK
jgi:D-beta-D-heptose 7-phosphate kinase/D-beta-D-heptose 1-phosphate adenosyltransferase